MKTKQGKQVLNVLAFQIFFLATKKHVSFHKTCFLCEMQTRSRFVCVCVLSLMLGVFTCLVRITVCDVHTLSLPSLFNVGFELS